MQKLIDQFSEQVHDADVSKGALMNTMEANLWLVLGMNESAVYVWT